ncbi:MAG: methyltransferase domain-containing protein, partial [Chloroflexia bacterium]|nr:methyltransferase domain-containing protein [Chloroflexia bacterium]
MHATTTSGMRATPPSSARRLHFALDTSVAPPRVRITVDYAGEAGPEPMLNAISVDEERPRLPCDDAVFDVVLAEDVIEHVLDEEQWLAELARVIRPGGRLTLRLPAAGPLAWLDELNLYRYLVETSHRGHAPRQTLPIGWHRRYTRADVVDMLKRAGFQPSSTRRVGIGLAEGPSLAGHIVL